MDHLVYRMVFADTDEREVPLPQPGLFDLDRRPWSITKVELDEKLSVQGFYGQHLVQDAPEEDYTTDYTSHYTGASSSSYYGEGSSTYHDEAQDWAPWD